MSLQPIKLQLPRPNITAANQADVLVLNSFGTNQVMAHFFKVISIVTNELKEIKEAWLMCLSVVVKKMRGVACVPVIPTEGDEYRRGLWTCHS